MREWTGDVFIFKNKLTNLVNEAGVFAFERVYLLLKLQLLVRTRLQQLVIALAKRMLVIFQRVDALAKRLDVLLVLAVHSLHHVDEHVVVVTATWWTVVAEAQDVMLQDVLHQRTLSFSAVNHALGQTTSPVARTYLLTKNASPMLLTVLHRKFCRFSCRAHLFAD